MLYRIKIEGSNDGQWLVVNAADENEAKFICSKEILKFTISHRDPSSMDTYKKSTNNLVRQENEPEELPLSLQERYSDLPIGKCKWVESFD